ncbi:MAG: DUF2252 domain-containing protein [Actinomycetales bacterium]|nr:DUF2252 domain-containing protein [Actinomycetales bacterium]
MRTTTLDERATLGSEARKRCTRPSIGCYVPDPDRPNPVDLLASQESVRVPLLLPIRHARMSVSPFTFYRGSAIIMASDLGRRPHTGLMVQLCGDAHLANFGMFAAPDRSLVFDINDFDETNPGPFEWDVLRLATSFVLSGREKGLPERAIRSAAEAAARGYRVQMAHYSGMPDIAVWYDRIDVSVIKQWAKTEGFGEDAVRRLDKSVEKARTRDSWSAVLKMTEVVDGRRRFLNQPPLLMPLPMEDAAADMLRRIIGEYAETLLRDRALLMQRYHLIDIAHKVVGVGSVGLLAFVLLMEGRDPDDLLVLQAKQALPSVLEPYSGRSIYDTMGERVVVGQRIMQAASDVFLGWVQTDRSRDLYVRQLRDMKYSPDPTDFTEKSLAGYAELCGRTLARAHARAGDSVAIASYLGTSTKFDDAVRDFALAYTEQVNADYALYKAAIADGTVAVADETKPTDYAFVSTPSGIEMVDPAAGPASS